MLKVILCAGGKSSKLISKLQTSEIPPKSFAKVSIDLMVDLSTSCNGNRNILAMVDHLTGWPMAKAIPDKEPPQWPGHYMRS